MIVALDLETTWLDKEKDLIIEIAMIKFDEKTFEIIEEFTSLINPWIKIPELNSNITWITDEMVNSSPNFEDLIHKIEKFIWDNPILWHNTYFDRDFLIEKWINIKNNIVLDTFFLANFLSIWCKSLSLESLCINYWLKIETSHRAYFDTKNTYLLFKKLLEEFEKLWIGEKKLLQYLFFRVSDKNIIFLRKFLFSKSEKLSFDEFVVLQLDKIKKNEIEAKSADIKKVEEFWNYYSKIKNFEKRENQLKLWETIEKNFFQNKKTVIEAPTWIWKTLAYLIPSIIYSKKTNKKVYISTKTKILQDQIYSKEILKIQNSINLDFTYTKIKWKNNYISLKSYFDFIKNFDIDYEKLSFLSKLSLWLTKTEFWELDELFYVSFEYKYIKYVNADNNKILDKSNKYLNDEFVYKNKKRLDKSDIVIINHSLLFSDLKNDFLYFWDLENLIIDEAHSIEDVVTDSLRKWFNMKQIEDLFFYIENIFKKNLFNLSDLLLIKEKIFININDFFSIFYIFLKTKTHNENYLISVLADNSFYDNLDEEYYLIWKNLKELFFNFIKVLSENTFDFWREIKLIEAIIDVLDKFINKDNCEDYVKIINFSQYEWVKIEYTILNVWKYLSQNFWSKLDNCFLISATLAIWENFSYLKKSLDLVEFEFLKFESDFDYSKQAVLYIPSDIWNIKNNFFHVKEFLKVFFEKVKWNTLVLFTSLSLVRETYLDSNFYAKSFGTKILAQSVSWSKNKLLESFLEEPDNSIILWTDSFWEWIDIPWSDLKYLIIHKMPFMVPSDPIYVSRSSLYENPFSDYSVPKSVLKLKQWFWRLIRTKNDYWAIIFLDNRIYSTQWWQIFYKSFPDEIKKLLITKNEIISSI